MGKKELLALIVIVCVILTLTFPVACAESSAPTQTTTTEPIVWKMHIWFSNTHVCYPELEAAVDKIAELSDGQLQIEIYPSFSLGFKSSSWFRDHKDGLIDISNLFNAYTCGEEPSFCVLEDPVFKNHDQIERCISAVEDFKKRVYSDIWDSELIAVGRIPSPYVIVATAGKQVKSLDDLDGLKLRVISTRMKAVFESFGAAPQSLPKGEVYMALKTGVLDGFQSGYGSLYQEKLYEVFDYVTVMGRDPALMLDIVISRNKWEPLPDSLKDIVRNVFGEWAEITRSEELAEEVAQKDKDLLEAAGIVCTELSEEDKTEFRAASMEEWLGWVDSMTGRAAEIRDIVKPIITE